MATASCCSRPSTWCEEAFSACTARAMLQLQLAASDSIAEAAAEPGTAATDSWFTPAFHRPTTASTAAPTAPSAAATRACRCEHAAAAAFACQLLLPLHASCSCHLRRTPLTHTCLHTPRSHTQTHTPIHTQRSALTDDDIISEVKALQEQGHRRILALTGEHPKYTFDQFLHVSSRCCAVHAGAQYVLLLP